MAQVATVGFPCDHSRTAPALGAHPLTSPSLPSLVATRELPATPACSTVVVWPCSVWGGSQPPASSLQLCLHDWDAVQALSVWWGLGGSWPQPRIPESFLSPSAEASSALCQNEYLPQVFPRASQPSWGLGVQSLGVGRGAQTGGLPRIPCSGLSASPLVSNPSLQALRDSVLPVQLALPANF